MFFKMLVRCFCLERQKKFKMKKIGALPAEVSDGGPGRIWSDYLKHLWLSGCYLNENRRADTSCESVSAALTKILDEV